MTETRKDVRRKPVRPGRGGGAGRPAFWASWMARAAQLNRDDPEYLRLLSTPSIPKKERCALLDEAFRGQVHLYVLNFMKLLCENGALRELPGCARAYRVRYNAAHGILEATADSRPCASHGRADRAACARSWRRVTGRHIDLADRRSTPAVLGGIRLDIEGTELDGTVQPAGRPARGIAAATCKSSARSPPQGTRAPRRALQGSPRVRGKPGLLKESRKGEGKAGPK